MYEKKKQLGFNF